MTEENQPVEREIVSDDEMENVIEELTMNGAARRRLENYRHAYGTTLSVNAFAEEEGVAGCLSAAAHCWDTSQKLRRERNDRADEFLIMAKRFYALSRCLEQQRNELMAYLILNYSPHYLLSDADFGLVKRYVINPRSEKMFLVYESRFCDARK